MAKAPEPESAATEKYDPLLARLKLSDFALHVSEGHFNTPGSLSDIVDRVRTAVGRKFSTDEQFAFVQDITKRDVVYEVGGRMFRSKYAISDSEVTFSGNPQEVVIQFVPKTGSEAAGDKSLTSESGVEMDLTESVITPMLDANESAVSPDGLAMVKLIEPGEGSSGHYSKEVLARDGAEAFCKGTHMFWNHDTREEAAARPEGDMNRLAAVLDADATYREDGPKGPGLYAPAIIREEFRAPIEELAPFTGVSIRARVRAEPRQESETPEITALLQGYSVDFVTKPGAGGQVLTAFEAAGRGEFRRGLSEPRTTKPTKPREVNMLDKNNESTKQLEEALTASRDASARLAGRLNRVEAQESVISAMTDYGLRDPAIRAKVMGRVLESIPVTGQGDIDQTKLTEQVKSIAESEVKYLKTIAGVGGAIRDLGEGGTVEPAKAVKESDIAEAFQGAGFGLSDKAALVAAK